MPIRCPVLYCSLLSTSFVFSPASVPAQEETTLPNGSRAVWVADPASERCAIEVWVTAGRRHEPVGKEGVARLTARLLRHAGTTRHGGPEAIAKLLESYRITLTDEVTHDRTGFRAECPLSARDLAMGLIAGLLAAPRVSEEDVPATVEALRREAPDEGPDPFDRERVRRTCGVEDRRVRPDTVQPGLTWADAVAFFGHYRPESTVIGIRGGENGLARVEHAFGSWRPSLPRPDLPTAVSSPATPPTIALIPSDREAEFSRAVLARGGAVADEAADYSALAVALAVWDTTTGQPGSSYVPGTAEILLPLPEDTPVPVSVERAVEVLTRLAVEGCTDDELARATERLSKTPEFDPDAPPEARVERAMKRLFRGWTEPPALSKVSTAAVRAAAARWLSPGGFHLVVEGPETLAVSLAKYAPVDKIPPPARDGRELLAKVVEAAGGADRLATLRTLSWTATRVSSADGQLRRDATHSKVRFPLHMWIESRGPASKTTTCFADTTGWQLEEAAGAPELGGDPVHDLRDMEAAQLADFKTSLLMSTTPLLQCHRELVAAELAPETVGDREHRVLRVTRPGVGTAEFLVDPDDFRIRRKRMTRQTSQGQVLHEEVLDRYGEVDGLWLPYSRTIIQNGQEAYRITANEFEVNPELDAKTFDKPQAGGS